MKRLLSSAPGPPSAWSVDIGDDLGDCYESDGLVARKDSDGDGPNTFVLK